MLSALENLPPLVLATDWDSQQDVTGWWISEKYDGFRCYWDGQQLLSRNGLVFTAPGWFTRDLPDVPLDGELWCGRGKLQRTAQIVRSNSANGSAWREVAFLVFDAPACPGPFEARHWHLHDALPRACPHVALVSQTCCQGLPHLREQLAGVLAAGGEGLMLRAPRSFYEPGRSAGLLRVISLDEAEGCVVERRPRSIVLEDDAGVRVGVICPAHEQPALGQVVTFQFSGRTGAGVPRRARLLVSVSS
jgi:DNA ligase-1